MTEEETRAAAYRAQAVRREAFDAAMERKLAGDPVARAALEANWQPIVDWNEQLKEPPDGEEDERQWNG